VNSGSGGIRRGNSCASRWAYLKSKSVGGIRINSESVVIDSLRPRLPAMGVDGEEKEVTTVSGTSEVRKVSLANRTICGFISLADGKGGANRVNSPQNYVSLYS
jgi:hypothetical protein